MKTIYFVRHGETNWNKEGRYQGITDIPLNEKGLAQAVACRDALANVHFDRIISSDLSRALVTAETIRGDRHIDIVTTSGLREVNFGDWETLTIDEIEEKWPGQIFEMYRRPEKIQLPNGESFEEVGERAWAVLQAFIEAVEEDETILVTCHRGTIRTLICKLLHLPVSYSWNFSQGNTGINRIFYNGMGEDDHNILNLLNDTKHADVLDMK